MQDDCIEVALELPELRILWQKELWDRFEVAVIYRREGANCPQCGKMVTKEHSRNGQPKKDRRLRDKLVVLILMKRRFRCPFCGRVFTEPDEVFGSRLRSSRRLRNYLGGRAMHQTVSRVAKEEGVSQSLVRRCFTEITQRQLELDQSPRGAKVMGLDEFSVKKRLFDTLITDPVERQVLGIVEGRGKENLERYLTGLPNPDIVRVVVMDMHEPFRQAVQLCLPMADIVTDKFHVVRRINEGVDKVRTRLQANEGQGRKGFLFHHRYLLLRKVESLNGEERVKLARLMARYPDLAKAWGLKEWLRRWYNSSSRQEAEEHLPYWEESIHRSGLKEFKALLSMFRNWRQEILNYFDHRVTNGFVEGKNNRTDVIKRMAYGYRNIDNLRRRILLCNNLMAANPLAVVRHHSY